MQGEKYNWDKCKILVDKFTGKEYLESDRLVDEKNGKLINWRLHKIQSEKLAEAYLRAGSKVCDEVIIKKSYRIEKCGSLLVYGLYSDGVQRLEKVYFCKVRLCSMCSWRRSLKVFGQVSKVMNYITEKTDYEYIFLTLTAKNVLGEDLSNELDRYFKAFDLLFRRKEVKIISKGWFRALEITRNWGKNNYHPHFHVIIAVNKSYFTDKRYYLSQKKWAELWQSCLGIDYEPIVDVRKIKPNTDVGDDEPFSVRYQKAVSEVAKYTLKASDVVCNLDEKQVKAHGQEVWEHFSKEAERLTDETIVVLDRALNRRRLVAFGGEFKAVHKLLSLDNSVDGDLVNTDNEDNIRDDVKKVLLYYRWVVGLKDYFK